MEKTAEIAGDLYRDLGQNLRALRLAAGFSQQQIAARLGVSFQQVQKYERGVNRLPLHMLPVLKGLYGVPYEEFFSETPFGARSAPARLPARDDIAIKISRRVAAIEDPALKAKIRKVIDILAA